MKGARCPRASAAALLLAASALLGAGALAPRRARGALPPRHGGSLTLPSPEPIDQIDPARALTPFAASLSRAAFDGLYEVDEEGRVQPVLADGMPRIEGDRATVRLLPGLVHQGRAPLTAELVQRSLQRAGSAPGAGWLLAGVVSEGGRLAIRAVDERTLELRLSPPRTSLARVLAAAPLAIVTGGTLERAPQGTGPYRIRRSARGAIELELFRLGPQPAGRLDGLRFLPPVDRDEELRAIELGRLDASWLGQSLYGGRPARPTRLLRAEATPPVLLLPNRRGALRDGSLWGRVARAVNRRRLAQAGLRPMQSLARGLPPPTLPATTPPPPTPAGGEPLRLRAVVEQGDRFHRAVAEAIAGQLDEAGIELRVEVLPRARYEAALARGGWDLRVTTLSPPLPYTWALVGAALAASGQEDQARALVRAGHSRQTLREASRQLSALVLGGRRLELHVREDLRGLRFDPYGRLRVEGASFARAPLPLRAPTAPTTPGSSSAPATPTTPGSSDPRPARGPGGGRE